METPEPRISYYALVADGFTCAEPSGIVRRIHDDPKPRDEAFGGDGAWHPTEYLMRYHYLGTMDVDHEEISAAEAAVILERWRCQSAERAD